MVLALCYRRSKMHQDSSLRIGRPAVLQARRDTAALTLGHAIGLVAGENYEPAGERRDGFGCLRMGFDWVILPWCQANEQHRAFEIFGDPPVGIDRRSLRKGNEIQHFDKRHRFPLSRLDPVRRSQGFITPGGWSR